MDEESSDSNSDADLLCLQGQTKKRKRSKHVQSFVDEWLTDKQFKEWLSKRVGKENKPQPYCKYCQKFVTCTKTGLKRHSTSNIHQKNTKDTSVAGTLTSYFTKSATRDETSSMEIKLCAFIAEHNLPISLSDDFIALLKSMFPLNNTLKNVTLGKQKATNVIRQVIGFDYLQEAVSALRERKFSVIIDETTDMSTLKQLAVLVTYFDMEAFSSKYYLLDMVEVADGTADGIYSAVKRVFSELHIPMNNIIGYSSDTTNVMFGEHHSVSKLLTTEYPNVATVKCSCHLIHLVASYAALKLPKGLEDLCRDIFNHFHRSSKRQDVYQQFQKFFNLEPHKILSPGQTRWLSLEACVNRILEQFQALEHYFILIANEDPTHGNDRILKSLNNKFTLAYLEFLSYQLQRFNAFNRLFQSERPCLHNLKGEIEGLLKSIASDFLNIQYVKTTAAKSIDPTNDEHHVPLKQVYLGLAASATMQEIEAGARNEDVQLFRNDCKNFLIESVVQIQNRFDSDSEVLSIVECISPQKANARMPSSLSSIATKLPYLRELDPHQLDLEWREHSLEEKVSEDLHWDEYWNAIRNTKRPTGEKKYQTLLKFVEILASLPFSNAAVERTFSLLKLIKTSHRSSLKSSSLVSLLQCKMKMKNSNVSAARLVPSDRVLKFASKMKANATDEQALQLKKRFLDEEFQ